MDRKELQTYALEVERQTQELKAGLRLGYKRLLCITKFIDRIVNDCKLEEQLKSKVLREAEIELMQIELTLDTIKDKVPKWEAKVKRLKEILNQGGREDA